VLSGSMTAMEWGNESARKIQKQSDIKDIGQPKEGEVTEDDSNDPPPYLVDPSLAERKNSKDKRGVGRRVYG
jgi:hypothetical protein